MPKRIFIQDGGLTSSVPTPAGYTVIGSDNGVPKKQIESTISDIGLPYKIYTALLTQSGTASPVATVFENTLGNIVWTRIIAGLYNGELAGAFTIGKTICPQFPTLAYETNGIFLPISSDPYNQLGGVTAFCQDDSNFQIQTTDMIGLSEWSTILGSSFFIEIRVYN